jgi:gas vesicle protein
MGKTFNRIAISTLLAAAAGYLAGILTAPKSGKETRKDIKHAAELTVTEAEKRLKQLHTQMDQVIKDGQEMLANLEGKARKELETAIAVTKATKEKARQMLSSVHEGHADDDELKEAIEDATKAVTHLKKYVKNVAK